MLDISNYYYLIENRATDKIKNMFAEDEIDIDTPLESHFTDNDVLELMCLRFSRMLEDVNAEVKHVNTVEYRNYQAAEFLVKSTDFELPIAVVFDYDFEESDDEEEITILGLKSIREYHSTYPLYEGHRIRDPVIEPQTDGDTTLKEAGAEPVLVYMEALTEGNVDQIIENYTSDAYFREPSGSEYKVVGRENLRNLYQKILSKGGIVLRHCNIIVDEETAAIEFIALKWGDTMLKPQAGIAFYDYSAKYIEAARVYDDVNPPKFD